MIIFKKRNLDRKGIQKIIDKKFFSIPCHKIAVEEKIEFVNLIHDWLYFYNKYEKEDET